MVVLAVAPDLIFRGKIKTAAAIQGVAVRMVTQTSSALAALRETPCTRILLDLTEVLDDPIALIASLRAVAPSTPIVGFCSHVQTALKQRALEAGCTAVLPRSVFVQRLPDLLAGS